MAYDGGFCFPLRHIANMGQTLRGKTYACKGDKTVWTKSIRSGWDKRLILSLIFVLKEPTTTHVLTSISIRRGTATREPPHFLLHDEAYRGFSHLAPRHNTSSAEFLALSP